MIIFYKYNHKKMILDTILNITFIYPVLVTLASVFYTLVTMNLTGILFAFGTLLFGFTGNIYLKQLSQYLFANFKPFQRPNPPKTGCGMFPNCRGKHNISNRISGMYTFGMPSGHAQISTMFAVFWSLYLINQNDEMTIGKYMSIISLILFTIIVSYARIYVGCHNTIQVMVGSLIGLIFGIILYEISNRIYIRHKKKIEYTNVIQIGVAIILLCSIIFFIL